MNREIRELVSGYEIRFDSTPLMIDKIAELATVEHLCCPFLDLGSSWGTWKAGANYGYN